ncbi:sperm acrosome membrane-associated protein 6-like [Leptodactylus fuscus]|uniref:sperm acrosome membrane-associated protein 6-like n=1 Tax=Leptodactylus fuscus TaxID=238119 RepID=UPI003F4EAE7D
MRFFHSYKLLLQLIVILCGAEVVRSCLRCFTTPADRASICQHAVSLGKMGPEECLQRLNLGFDPLNDISLAFSQMDYVRKYLKTFEKEVKKFDKSASAPAWVEQFDQKMAQYVKAVKSRAASYPPAQCSPPCGLQKAARAFTCSRCAEEDCQLPVACPIESIKVNELDTTNIYCGASFILPDKLKVVWKYAKNMKVTDSSYFKDIHTGEDLFVMIKPTRVSHKGTYACEIFDEDDDIIIRKFYYLDVARSTFGDQMQMEFQRALVEKLPTQEDEEERLQHGPSTTETILSYLKSPISYAIYAGVCFLVIILVVGYLARYSLNVEWRNRKKYSPLTSPPYP